MTHSPALNRAVDTSAVFKPPSLSLSLHLLSSGARVFSLYQLYNLIELQSDSRKHRSVISHLLPRALPLFRLFNDTEADLAKY